MVGSSQDGQIWSENINLTSEAFNPTYGSSIAVDGNNIYVVWADERYQNPENEYHDFEIFFKKSADGGKFWGEDDIRLTNNSNQHTKEYWCNDFDPYIIVDGDTPHVVWHRNIGGIGEGKKPHFEIFYKKSVDAGRTWHDEKQLTNTSFETIGPTSPRIATDGEGTLHLSYHGEDHKIYYMKSLDRGENWSQLYPLSDKDSDFVDIAWSNGSLHLIYNGPNDYIYYIKSEDNGFSWSDTKKLAPTQFEGHVSADDKLVCIVYSADRGDGLHTYFMRSTDSGNTWSSEIKLVTYPSADPDICISNEYIHVVWKDGRDWNPETQIKEIYYKTSKDYGASWSSDLRLTYLFGDSTQPKIASQNEDIYVIFSNFNYMDNRTYIYFKRTKPYTGFKPVITVISPKDGERIKCVEEGTRVWINGTAYSTNPNTTILKVEIKIGIKDWVVANGTTNWSYLWDLTQLTQADRAATNYTGNFTIFARAWDGHSYSEYYKLTVHYMEPGRLYSDPLWDIIACVVLSVFSIICLVIVALHVLRFRKKRT